MGSNMEMIEAEDLPPFAESSTEVKTTKEGPFIQIGERNQMTFHDKVGQVTQVGRQNIIKFLTEKKKYRLTIKSRSTDVETEISYNIILPNEDFPAPDTNTLMLGETAEAVHVQDDIEMQIDFENNDTRLRLRTDEETLFQTRSCLSSLFRGVDMAVQWLREGSIIIGLQPTTERAVLTLMKAMEEGFLKDLVQNILENQIASDTKCSLLDVDEPIKMKIEVNIPKAMFPKNFSCRQYSSMTEIIEELKITIQEQEKFEKGERKGLDVSNRKKVEFEKSEEETRKREETMASTMDMIEAEELPPLAESTTIFETTTEAPFIHIGKRNQMTFHDKVGQVTQFGRQNTIKFLTEKKKYRLTIKSRSTDVETEISYNIILPNEGYLVKTLMLGETAESPHVQDDIEMRIDVENNDTRHRLHIDEYALLVPTWCGLRSLFGNVNIFVKLLFEGSIIIGLEPTTQQTVLTLMKAMEKGFLKDLVQNILEYPTVIDTDCSVLDVDEPIKMKIEVNIPKRMFPKNFKFRQYSSMADVLKELSITIQEQQFKKERKREAPSKINEVELAKMLIQRSEEETKKKEETVVTVRNIAGKVETLGTSLNIAFGIGGVLALASMIAAPFTFGGSVAAAGVGGAALIFGFLLAVAKVIDEIKAQKIFIEYENMVTQLVEALTLLLDTEDKESVHRSLTEALKDKPIHAKNQTLKIILEDINNVRVGNIFTVPVDNEKVLLKDFDVLQYIKKRISKRERPSIIGTDLRKLADDLDQYQVLVR